MIATLKISVDVFLIKSILKNIEVSFDKVSLIGDNRVIISFASKDNMLAFLNSKCSFQEYFSQLLQWDDHFHVSKRFLLINIYGVPPQFWTVSYRKWMWSVYHLRWVYYFKEHTRYWSHSDFTSLDPTTSSLQFQVNGKHVSLKLLESHTGVELLKDVDDAMLDD